MKIEVFILEGRRIDKKRKKGGIVERLGEIRKGRRERIEKRNRERIEKCSRSRESIEKKTKGT